MAKSFEELLQKKPVVGIDLSPGPDTATRTPVTYTMPDELFLTPGTEPETVGGNLGSYLPPAEKIRLLEAEIDQLEDELVEVKQDAKDKLNTLMQNSDELIVNYARLQLERDSLREHLRHAQTLVIEYLADLQIYKAHPWRLVLDKLVEIIGRFLP